jgi:hypothetical protein
MCRKHGDESRSHQRIGTSWSISAGRIVSAESKQTEGTLGMPLVSKPMQSNKSLLLHRADNDVMFQRTEKERDVES